MKDRFRNNHNRPISLGDRMPFFAPKKVSILGFDDTLPYGKYKGGKVIDIIKKDWGCMAYYLKARTFLFTKEVGDEIKKLRSEFFAGKYTYEERNAFFNKKVEKVKEAKSKVPKVPKVPKVGKKRNESWKSDDNLIF